MIVESHKGSAIYLGDAFDLLKEVEPGSVDLILTDPPYNVSRKNNLHTMGRRGIEFEWDGEFDQVRWLEDAAKALKRGGSIVIFNDWKNLGDIARALDSSGLVAKRDLTWKKANPLPRNILRSYVQAREYAIWGVKPGAKWTFNFEKTPEQPYHRGEFRYPVQRGLHPTKKPDGLFADLIRLHSNPGELVLDPFLGCGTTVVAAMMTGRRVLGFEKDERYYQEALRRWGEVRS